MASISDPRQRSALVAYGSETGNSFDYAEEIGRSLERIHFSSHVANLDAPSLKHYTIVIVVVSTTGQGDLPSNARSFWRALLKKNLPRTYLENVRFTSFGLGDSSYPKFNWAARKLHKRLAQLGAAELLPRGEADDQHDEGSDAAFVPWALNLCRQIIMQYPLSEDLRPIADDVLLPPKWLLSLVGEAVNSLTPMLNGRNDGQDIPNGDGRAVKVKPVAGSGSLPGHDNSTGRRLNVILKENRRMTPESHWQDVRQLAFDTQSTASYGPGDVLTIYPHNATEDVNQIIDLMGWSGIADKLVDFVSTNGSGRHPCPPLSALFSSPIMFRDLLTNHYDLTAIPRRSFFSLIAHFTTDQFHKDRLLEFTKPEYVDELYDYTTRPRRSILEVLQEFESVKIPWQWAANVLPELRGRQFSIASGGQLKQTAAGFTRFELLVAIVKYKTVIKKIRQGVCTRYLAGLQEGVHLTVTLQTGGLRITQAEAARPVIMIGPGTGVAPMRALIWERLQWKERTRLDGRISGEHTSCDSILFFGCRNKDSDNFYKDEWDRLQGHMPLRVFAAFSRDQRQKTYVQDLVRQEAKEVFRLLHSFGGIIYVCGSSGKMPTAVRAALSDVFRQCNQTSQAEAEASVERLEKEGRYKQETW